MAQLSREDFEAIQHLHDNEPLTVRERLAAHKETLQPQVDMSEVPNLDPNMVKQGYQPIQNEMPIEEEIPQAPLILPGAKKVTQPQVSPVAALQTTLSQPPKDFGYGADINDAALAKALQDKEQATAWSNVAAGLAQAGASIGAKGTREVPKINEDNYNVLAKGSGQKVHDIQTKRTAAAEAKNYKKAMEELTDDEQKRDPHSPISEYLKGAMKEFFPSMKVPEGTSAAQLEKSGFNLAKMVDAKEASKSRAAQAAMTQALMGKKLEIAESGLGLRMNKSIIGEKQVVNLDTMRDRAEEGLRAIKNAKVITPEMYHDLTTSYAAILAGRNSMGLAQLQGVTMDTFNTKTAALEEKLKSGPVDISKSKEVEYIRDALQRVKENTEELSKERKAVLAKSNKPVVAGNSKLSSIVNQYIPSETTQQTTPNVQQAVQSTPNEERRIVNGKNAIFNRNTKEFIRWE